MSKINFNTENPEIEITRAIGKKSEGKITLNTEGGSIEIDLGFASVGATTDYGGAISVGLLGQEITWGREGGTIHIGIGGFAVDVEARDCIVTEVKSIFGIIVAQRSYPDPGCKPPPETPGDEPIKQPDPSDFEPIIPKGLDTDALVYVLIKAQRSGYGYNLSNAYKQKDGPVNLRSDFKIESEITASDIPKIVPIRSPSSLPFKVSGKLKLQTVGYERPNGTGPQYPFSRVLNATFGNTPPTSANNLWYQPNVTFFVLRVSGLNRVEEDRFTVSPHTTIPTLPYEPVPVIAYGPARRIRDWITGFNIAGKGVLKNFDDWQFVFNYQQLTVVQIIPVGEQAPSKPFLPTGNKPPMNNCCEEVLDMLEDIKEPYAVDRILKDKFPISNIFMAPGCDPASQTIAKNFYEILQCLFRTLAHGLIFEPSVNIKDADAAKAGDQEFKAKYLNATGWASAVAEALLEVKDDGNVSTNMDIRNAFAVTQTMVGLSDAIYRLNALIDSIGVEVIPRIETVDTPYNLQIQIGKGFGEGNERQIDLNQDEATEKLLPELLKVKTNKIKTVETHPRSRSIKDILESIESNLPTINNG
ncbi:hypothetical protein [Tychonema sp. LEGE 06208]|uniref:hypothetical protein n=1 Tax=Tychonema sp. LEGE 06208 TaxID=1828663 RepID=UPI00187EC2F2|nr:hypothetical protein [Tychonema sp. LEGE 06208]MBE9164184.1 hypothetical protein [Tychonema sp. LEGE 06208]